MHENTPQKIDLFDLLRGLGRCARHFFLRGCILSAVLALLLVWRTGASYVPMYQASASFTVQMTNTFSNSQHYYNAAAAKQMATTFPHILTSGVMTQQVKDRMGITHMPAISATSMGETNIFTLKVTSTDPQLSYDVLQCVIEVYPEVAEFVVGPTVLTFISESGVPVNPTDSPSYAKSALLGIVLGAAVWAGASLAYWVTHRTVSSEEELKKVVNVACLGRLPRVGGVKKKGCPTLNPSNDKFGFSESVRLLRVRTEKALAPLGNTVLVTSSIANEGKTTVSINLALAMARKGRKVLLVDCDLRNPSVARTLGMENDAGMSDYLRSRIDLERIIRQGPQEGLFVVAGGKPVNHPEDLLSRQPAQRFIETVRKNFDFIILDTPPCALMPDAAELLALADGAILTVRQDHANVSQITEGVQMLFDSKKPIIGCVLNMTRPKLGRGSGYSYYGYGYGYGYGYYGGKKGEVLDEDS